MVSIAAKGATGAALLALALASGAAAAQEVNLYSSRHYDTDVALYDGFAEQTGIEVNLIEASEDELIERIKAEGANSPADVLITVDAGRLWRAEDAGLFQPVSSAVLQERIPAKLRHPEGKWFGLSQRLRGATSKSTSAVVVPPVVTQVLNTNYWPDFPWQQLNGLYDVWMPMAYGSNRTPESGWRDGYRLPRIGLDNPIGNVIVRLASRTKSEGVSSYLRTHVGRAPHYDTSKIQRELGMKFRPVAQTILETMDDLVRWKHLPAR